MTEYATTTWQDTIGYDVHGPSLAAPSVVFVAGAGPFRAIDPDTTQTAILLAERGVRSVVFDRLGRGDSPAGGVLHLDRELGAVAAAVEVAGPPAVLVGHSSGCAIALRAAADGLPVSRLVLWEAPLAGSAHHMQQWADEFERRLDAGDMEGATRQYMRDMPPEWLATAEASPMWSMMAAASVSNRADAQSLAWAAASLESGDLASLSVPVLATYGVETFPEMPAAATRLAETIPLAGQRRLPGSQHRWEPAAMAEAIAEFMA